MSEEAPSAPESASTSTATTEVFHSLRRSLIAIGKRGEVDAFQHLCDLVNVGVERRTMRSVLRNAHLRKFFGGVVSDDPALIRAYLDAKRGMKPPPAPTSEKDSPNKFSARMTARLTTDQTFFAHSAGALYRVPERIAAQDLLAAMRRLEPPLPGVQHVSLAETRAFVAEWDSSDYVHRDAGRMHALDFAIFMRFADAANDVEGVTNDLGVFANPPGSFARTSARRATETVRRQAKDAVATKRKFATRDARREFVRREGEALVECLREELRVYEAQRSPAVGGVEVPHAFKVEYAPGLGCVGKLTPEPTLALALAALDASPRGATGFVSPPRRVSRWRSVACRSRPWRRWCSAIISPVSADAPPNTRGTSTSFSRRWNATGFRESNPTKTLPRWCTRGRRARGARSTPSTWRDARRTTRKWSCCDTSPRPRRRRSGATAWSKSWTRPWQGTDPSPGSSRRWTTSSDTREAGTAAARARSR